MIQARLRKASGDRVSRVIIGAKKSPKRVIFVTLLLTLLTKALGLLSISGLSWLFWRNMNPSGS